MSAPSVQLATDALDAVAREAWADRPASERIIAQNAALRLAICATFRDDQVLVRDAIGVLRRRAIEEVHALALPRAQLDAMGDAASPDISQWIGDPSGWRDQRPLSPVGFHEQGYGFTKAIRTLVVGTMLVNLGQLVAIDTEWRPHVTPIVGSLEIRRPLDSPQATLCAASLDLDWLRCGAPAGLRPFGEGAARVDPHAAVVFRTDGIIAPCRSCHAHLGSPKGIPLLAGTQHDSVEARRKTLFRELTERITRARRPD